MLIRFRYRRTSTNQYDIPNVFQDLAVEFLAYPSTFRLGGNVNGVNTYEGVNLTDFTSGVVNTDDLFDLSGTGAACFYAQLVQATIPDFANAGLAAVSAVTDLLNSYITPIAGNLDCPVVDQFDQSLFNQFPGRTYSPTGPATNYRRRL